jgi:hypothetical protein
MFEKNDKYFSRQAIKTLDSLENGFDDATAILIFSDGY